MLPENTKTIITETDYESMCRLAEDVMQELYMNFSAYDEEGNDIFAKHYGSGQDFEKEILPKIREEQEKMFEDPNCNLLHDLFRRGDKIGDVRYYTLEDIRSWIEPILPRALQMFRKGTGDTGETEFAAAPSVSDEYLIEAFAREVRNMMMIFAGQQLQQEDIPRYLLLLENPSCHDGDEWMGIYFDNQDLKKAYEELQTELEKKQQRDGNYRSMQLSIWEFRPAPDYEEVPRSEDVINPKQELKRVQPKDLRCFQEKKEAL